MQQKQEIRERLVPALEWARVDTTERRPCVYVMSGDGNTVKIGVSGDLVMRLRAMRGHSGRKLVVSHSLTCESLASARRIEAAAHRLLAEQRVFREWFKVSAYKAREAVEEASRTTQHPRDPQRTGYGARRVLSSQAGL